MRSKPHETAKRSIAILAGAILMTACTPRLAASEPQDRELAVDQVAGFWALTEVGGGARCTLALSNLVIEGVRPVLVERCTVPAVVGARSWRATAKGFELMGPDGVPMLAFRRTDEDAFEEVDRRFRLSRAPLF